MSELKRLCRERAGLSAADILRLSEVEKQLPLIAELTGADMFWTACWMGKQRW